LFPQHAAVGAVPASHPWVGAAILAGGFAFFVAGLDAPQRAQYSTLPAAMNTSVLRIACAALLVVLGIWAGSRVPLISLAPPSVTTGIPVPAGEAQCPHIQADLARSPEGAGADGASPPDALLPGGLTAFQDPDRFAAVLARGPRRQGHFDRVTSAANL